MRFLLVAKTGLLDLRRDPVVLVLSLVFAPVFIILYWLMTQGAPLTYPVAVADAQSTGSGIAAELSSLLNDSGVPLVRVIPVDDVAAAEQSVRNKDAVAGIAPPANMEKSLRAGHPVEITVFGDPGDARYAVAAILIASALDDHAAVLTGEVSPVSYEEVLVGDGRPRTDFDLYVPGIIVFSTILLVFLSALLVAREIESGTLLRLRLTALRPWEYLTGVTMVVVAVGVAGLLFTIATAWAFGFRSQGPMWVTLLVGVLSAVSVVPAGLIVASFSRTTTQAFVIANFPLGLLTFFSGAIYPIPRGELFTIAGTPVAAADLLPATHAVTALQQVLAMGGGLGAVGGRLAWLVALTVLYGALGVRLFRRRVWHVLAG